MGDLDYVKRPLKYIHPQKSGQEFRFTDLQSALRLSKRLDQAVFGSCHGQAVHTSEWPSPTVLVVFYPRIVGPISLSKRSVLRRYMRFKCAEQGWFNSTSYSGSSTARWSPASQHYAPGL
jgi:hypothetical protein